MKNVMKKILLFGCLMGVVSNLVAMFPKLQRPIRAESKHPIAAKKAATHTVAPKAESKEQELGTFSLTKFKNPCDQLLDACDKGDVLTIKRLTQQITFTSREIERIAGDTSNSEMQKFLSMIHALFYLKQTDIVGAYKEIKEGTKEAVGERFLYTRFVIDVLELALVFKKPELVLYILEKYEDSRKALLDKLSQELIIEAFELAVAFKKADLVKYMLDTYEQHLSTSLLKEIIKNTSGEIRAMLRATVVIRKMKKCADVVVIEEEVAQLKRYVTFMQRERVAMHRMTVSLEKIKIN